MNGKELIFAKMQGKSTKRVPWVPFAGIHAGKLVDVPADILYKDPKTLLKALIKVNELYKPDGQPVMFDLQLEAEALGCELKWASNNPPSVISHPWEKITEIPKLEFNSQMGRLPLLIETTKALKQAVGDSTAIFGLFTGPLTLASHLRGTQLYLDMIRNKDLAVQIFSFCTKIAIKMIDIQIEAGADVISLVDPVISQISPRSFTNMLGKQFTSIFDYIRQKNRISSFFVCGDATKIIPAMCETKPDSIFVDENVNMKTAQTITDQFNIILGGNIPLATTMLFGTQQDNMKFVIDLLKNLNTANLIIAPGCDMPYDIPLDNVIGVAEAIARPKEIEESIKNYESPPFDIEVTLPDYSNLNRPLIELFTIDSVQCAACQYMKKVAIKALDKFKDQVDLVEYKWIELENIVRTKKMGIKHLPCIYIDGQLKWSSIIPQEESYYAEIRTALRKYQ